MRKISSGLLLATLLTMPLGGIPVANAALNPPAQVLAAISPANGFPMWYQDITGLALAPCLDQNSKCVLTPADPTAVPPIPSFDPAFPPFVPVSTGPAALLTPQNYPIETFYWLADVVGTMPVTVGATTNSVKFKLRFALEGGFATLLTGAVQNGQQSTFIRINCSRIASGLVPGGTYTVTHPYGSFTFTADAGGGVTSGLAGQTFRNQVGGVAPLDFSSILPGTLAPTPGQAVAVTIDDFLVWDPAGSPAPAGYIGDPLIPHGAVKASAPGVPVSVTVTGPGIAVPAVFTQFLIAGKKFGMDIAPTTNDFGAVAITSPPATSAPVTFTVTNVNTVSAMTLGAITLVGATNPGTGVNADFIINPLGTDTCAAAGGTVLAIAANPPVPASSCTVSYAFSPKPLAPAAEVAVRKATVNIAATAPAGTPAGQIALSGTAQFTMAASAGANGAITPAGAAVTVNAGANQAFTIQPNPKFQVKDITVNGALAHFNPAAKLADPVIFSAPAATASGATVNATFMPSGDLDGNGALDVADALKGLKILVGLQAPVGDDLVAMKIAPLDATGRPSGTGTPDLNDVVLILKRGLGIVTW